MHSDIDIVHCLHDRKCLLVCIGDTEIIVINIAIDKLNSRLVVQDRNRLGIH